MRKAFVWFCCLALIGAMGMVVGCDDSDSTYISPGKPAPKDVSTSTTAKAAADNGVVKAGTVLTTAATSGAAQTVASVAFGEGSKITGADGKPFTGDVTYTIKASDSVSEATFAGGSFTKTENGKTVTYKSLGSVSISATDKDGKPLTITGPVTATIKLAPGIKMPNGQAVKEGDSVPIYGWGADGKMVLQGYAKVTKDATGALVAGFTANQFMPNFAIAFGAEPTSP